MLNINGHLGKKIKITSAQERVNSAGLDCSNPAHPKERSVLRTDPWNIPWDILPGKSVFVCLSPLGHAIYVVNTRFCRPNPWAMLHQLD